MLMTDKQYEIISNAVQSGKMNTDTLSGMIDFLSKYDNIYIDGRVIHFISPDNFNKEFIQGIRPEHTPKDMIKVLQYFARNIMHAEYSREILSPATDHFTDAFRYAIKAQSDFLKEFKEYRYPCGYFDSFLVDDFVESKYPIELASVQKTKEKNYFMFLIKHTRNKNILEKNKQLFKEYEYKYLQSLL